MIKIQRSSPPTALSKNRAKWLRELKAARRQYGINSNDFRKVQSKYNHPSIRACLGTMFKNKCAYCESKLGVSHFPRIDHFKPKSRYENLTFDWDNLILSCEICNSAECKGDHFPSSKEGGPLLNPCKDDPQAHLEFKYDRLTHEAVIGARTIQGETTVRVLKLMERSDLRKYRSEAIGKLVVIIKFAKSEPDARSIMQMAVQDDAEYAAFARALA
ncbi:MAG: TIGR02646 family protein [Candidatus Sumerlaeota bacterium]|nr:TIGR02646 family protein [Candidatus Sumerlaeota bacterium]